MVGKDPESQRSEKIKVLLCPFLLLHCILVYSSILQCTPVYSFSIVWFLLQKEEQRLRASVRLENQRRRWREKEAQHGLTAQYLETGSYEDELQEDEVRALLSVYVQEHASSLCSECVLLLLTVSQHQHIPNPQTLNSTL